MANVYSGIEGIVAAWRFEPGSLATDSVSGNTLTLVNTPTEDTTNHIEGSGCMSLAAASSQSAKIDDAALPASFPFQSGNTDGIMTICMKIRPTTVDANARVICSKFTPGNSNKQQWSIRYTSSLVRIATPSFNYTIGAAMTANQKYFLAVWVNNALLKYRSYMYNYTAGTWAITSGALSAAIYTGATRTGAFSIGNDDGNATTNLFFNGQIDEMIVANRKLYANEIVLIKDDILTSLTDVNKFDFAVHPVSGNNSNHGMSWDSPWVDFRLKTFVPGDRVYIAKSIETAQAGTVTATIGSKSITTTSDLTAALPALSVFRLDNDTPIYMVKSITADTISLYRPYRGTTGDGKTIKKITNMTTETGAFNPASCVGNTLSRISWVFGVNPETNIQDGITLVTKQYGIWGGNIYLYFTDISNVAIHTYYYGFYTGDITNCTMTNIYFFNLDLGAIYTLGLYRTTLTNIVSEAGKMAANLYNSSINGIECSEANSVNFSIGTSLDSIITDYKCSGLAGASSWAIGFSGSQWGLKFYRAILDESITGIKQISVQTTGTGLGNAQDVVFYSPMIGAGTLCSSIGGASWGAYGDLHFTNINGDPTDNRTYTYCGKSVKTHMRSPDYSIYHTSAPSVKITGANEANAPYYTRHYIPCEAGVAKTVSVYVRKNSSYGSSTLPFMRVIWPTGTGTSMVTNSYDVTMTDVTDEWQQLSKEVTPSVKGGIIVEIWFQSATAGALMWYDDLVAG